jgi:hypothetical protein
MGSCNEDRMPENMRSNTLTRRDWLKLLAVAAGGILLLPEEIGCSYYTGESGAAYAPWDFPGTETRPEMIAAWAAILASNAHNAQPWALHVTPTKIDLRADFTRNTGTVDGLLREMYLSLGCALENLAIAARASGRAVDVALLPDASDASLIASVTLVPSAPSGDALFGAIARRHTNRGRYADAPPPAKLHSTLSALISEPDVELTFLTSEADKQSFRTHTVTATKAFNADAQMSADSNSWFRQTEAEILQYRDGITLDCSGNSELTKFWGKSMSRASDATANSYWLGSTEGDQSTASAFCILTSPDTNLRVDQLRVGRVYQRMHLWASNEGLAMQPLNQMAERQDREEVRQLAPDMTSALNGLIGRPGRRGQMLFRIGYPWDSAPASPRRSLESVVA